MLEGGGYCALFNSGTSDGDTYYLTEEQFVTAETTDYTIPSSLKVEASDTNELAFELFQCTWASADAQLTCSKF